MVERDRFDKQFGAGWRIAYRYAWEGDVPVEAVCDKLVASLTRALRENGGIPDLSEMSRIVNRAGELGLISAFGALDDIAEQLGGHRHTVIAAEVAKSLIVQRTDTSDVSGPFAEAACAALVEHYFFARARQPLLADQRFASYEAVGGWQSRVEEVLRPQISKVAAALWKHPDGRKVKAPPRLAKKESTRELLAENILGMQPSDRSMAGRSR